MAISISLKRVVFSSLFLWLIISLIGVYFLFHLHKFINFGIDLVGGTYITLEVQVDKAVESELASRLQSMTATLKKEFALAPESQSITTNTISLTFKDAHDTATVEAWLYKQNLNMALARQENTLTLTVSADEIKKIAHDAVESNIKVLHTRLDKFGVGEVLVAPQGEKNIVIELPNVHNPQQAKAMIGRAAVLEFKLLEDEANSEEELLDRNGGCIPEGMIIVSGEDKFGGLKKRKYYLVSQFADISGKMLKDAHMNPFGGKFGTEPIVAFQLNQEGGERFYELTGENVGRKLAIIIDNEVISAPNISVQIGAEGSISGNFTQESAQDLALLLKSGAFVAPVTFEEERHIGPSLGQESIQAGLRACAVGLGLLGIFSLIVYKTAGLFAFIVLLYNLLLILFALAMVGATLTLPGIAGMILTIGMAIDASILIFERIREELHAGVPLNKAINHGFSGAMTVILDANITHLLVAVVLYKLGAGPIQGFAVAMIIGIFSTLLTGLLLLKSIFNFYVNVLGIHKLKI
ncbi:MAG: protein translocase subunit SecD [Candidatus Babeliaceae bacterium]